MALHGLVVLVWSHSVEAMTWESICTVWMHRKRIEKFIFGCLHASQSALLNKCKNINYLSSQIVLFFVFVVVFCLFFFFQIALF